MEQEPTSTKGTDSDTALNILARQLAQNYFDTSLSASFLPKSDDRRATARRVFTEDYQGAHELGPPCRNILVIGAGASAAAFGKDAFPTTDKAVEKLNAVLEERVGPLPEWLDKKMLADKERLKLAYGFTDALQDFETHLALLSRAYPPQAVSRALSDLYGERYWPHLTFEIIAHLLKHRFVDVVVNFNFDELLDQAIEEEIGRSQYHYVISDGQCRSVEDVMVDNRLKVPIHIKPHGTASHTSTLRFTKEHYFALPEGMRTFLRNIVSGRTRDDDDERPGVRYRTNIISVGYGMKSVDLLQILQETSKPDDRLPDMDHLSIFHLNTTGWYSGAEDWLKSIGTNNQHLIDVTRFGTLQGTLLKLWERIGECFNDRFRPRGIARHRIVHTLFVDEAKQRRVPEGGGNDIERKWERDAHYYYARLCTELVIALARGNGRVDLETMVDERLGMYFDKLREVDDAARKRRAGLAELEAKDGRRRISKRLQDLCVLDHSIHRVADALAGNEQLDFGGYESAVLTASFQEMSNDDIAAWLWRALRRALGAACRDLDEHLARIVRDQEKSAALVEWLRLLVASDTYDINADFRHRHLLLFREPNPDEVLHTGLSLTLKFAEILELEWDLMLAVSEHGKILGKYFDHQPGSAPTHRRCCVIVADSDRNAEMEERLRGYAPSLIGGDTMRPWYSLPYWGHNHHMLVLLKKNRSRQGQWDRVAGLSYEKSGLSNRVNPIFFRDIDYKDLKRLESIFFGYVFEAENPGWWYQSPDEHAARFRTRPQLALAQGQARARELKELWWKEFD